MGLERGNHPIRRVWVTLLVVILLHEHQCVFDGKCMAAFEEAYSSLSFGPTVIDKRWNYAVFHECFLLAGFGFKMGLVIIKSFSDVTSLKGALC